MPRTSYNVHLDEIIAFVREAVRARPCTFAEFADHGERARFDQASPRDIFNRLAINSAPRLADRETARVGDVTCVGYRYRFGNADARFDEAGKYDSEEFDIYVTDSGYSVPTGRLRPLPTWEL